MQKLRVSHLSLHGNLLERACNHIKLYSYILKVLLEMSRNNNSVIPKYSLKTGQNEKSYLQEIGISETYVQLFEHFQNLIALQVWCLAFTKNFEWLANGISLGQSSLSRNSSWGKICKKI